MLNSRLFLLSTSSVFLLSAFTIQPANAQAQTQAQLQAQYQSQALYQAQAQAQQRYVAQAPRQARSTNTRNLPPVLLDSFVKNAGGQAEQIYGDESMGGSPPPYFRFSEEHRIGTGINGSGLTTGHGSMMPSAWGGDEFVGAEWVNTSQGNAAYYGNTQPGVDLSAQMMQYDQQITNALGNNNLTGDQLQNALTQDSTQLMQQMNAAEGF